MNEKSIQLKIKISNNRSWTDHSKRIGRGFRLGFEMRKETKAINGWSPRVNQVIHCTDRLRIRWWVSPYPRTATSCRTNRSCSSRCATSAWRCDPRRTCGQATTTTMTSGWRGPAGTRGETLSFCSPRLGFTSFSCFFLLRGITGLHRILFDLMKAYGFLLDFTRFYRIFPDFSG